MEKITKERLVEMLKDYDFMNNSIRSFSKKYNINCKTVSKYLREYNINYNQKHSVIARHRDVTGRYCLPANDNKETKTKTIDYKQSSMEENKKNDKETIIEIKINIK